MARNGQKGRQNTPSSSVKAGDPARRGGSDESLTPRRIGSPGQAVRRRPEAIAQTCAHCRRKHRPGRPAAWPPGSRTQNIENNPTHSSLQGNSGGRLPTRSRDDNLTRRANHVCNSKIPKSARTQANPVSGDGTAQPAWPFPHRTLRLKAVRVNVTLPGDISRADRRVRRGVRLHAIGFFDPGREAARGVGSRLTQDKARTAVRAFLLLNPVLG